MKLRKYGRIMCVILMYGTTGGSPVSAKEICTDETRVLRFLINAAGNSDKKLVLPSGVEGGSIPTHDGKRLTYFVVRARDKTGGLIDSPKGYVLVLPGNAQLAETLVIPPKRSVDKIPLAPLAERGYDVYVFQYRGYGRSNDEESPSLESLFSDINVIVEFLKTAVSKSGTGYGQRFAYTLSGGGVVLLNATVEQNTFDAVVLDSMPGNVNFKTSWLAFFLGLYFNFQCPSDVQPENLIKKFAARIGIIQGGRDEIVPLNEKQKAFLRSINKIARVVHRPEWGHPFAKGDSFINDRLQLAIELLEKPH